jgi:hypothetical protein
MGFRSFNLDELSAQAPYDQPNQPWNPVDLVSRREAASAQDDPDAYRWSDDGSDITSEAVAQGPRTR